MGVVLVEAVPSVVGFVVGSGLDEAGHFGCCYSLFLLILTAYIVSLYQFGLAYLLLLVVTVVAIGFNDLVSCSRFFYNLRCC